MKIPIAFLALLGTSYAYHKGEDKHRSYVVTCGGDDNPCPDLAGYCFIEASKSCAADETCSKCANQFYEWHIVRQDDSGIEPACMDNFYDAWLACGTEWNDDCVLTLQAPVADGETTPEYTTSCRESLPEEECIHEGMRHCYSKFDYSVTPSAPVEPVVRHPSAPEAPPKTSDKYCMNPEPCTHGGKDTPCGPCY